MQYILQLFKCRILIIKKDGNQCNINFHMLLPADFLPDFGVVACDLEISDFEGVFFNASATEIHKLNYIYLTNLYGFNLRGGGGGNI